MNRYIIVLNRGIDTEILLNIEERLDIVQFSELKFSNVHLTVNDSLFLKVCEPKVV